MSSSIAAFALHRAIRTMIKLRHFSFLASSLSAPRVLAPKTLTPSRILSSISDRFAFTKAVNAEDKIRRTDSDENLLRVLEGKIDEQAPLVSLEAELPKDSPFEIIDKPGKFKLKRDWQGEKLKVVVYKYFDGNADEEKSEQDATEGQNTNDDRQPHISLFVTVDKADQSLRFWCNLYAEDFKIKRAKMRRPKEPYEGFDYSIDLDEGLRKAFNEYLGARGIKVSLYKFLRGYFVTMDDRKYVVWLKNLKEFMEN